MSTMTVHDLDRANRAYCLEHGIVSEGELKIADMVMQLERESAAKRISSPAEAKAGQSAQKPNTP